jgi:hypothetical protein
MLLISQPWQHRHSPHTIAPKHQPNSFNECAHTCRAAMVALKRTTLGQ